MSYHPLFFSDSKYFSPFLFCAHKPDKHESEFTWTSPHSFDLEQKKDACNVLCRSHRDHVLMTFKYDANDTLQELFSVGRLEKAMASAGYVSLLFALDTLADSKVYSIYAWEEDPASHINFSVDRMGEFALYQCVVSADKTRALLLLSDKVTSPQSFDVQIYSRRPAAFAEGFSGNMFEMEYQISGLQPYCHIPMVKFDPRYYSSRLWLVNVKSFQFSEFSGYVKGYNIDNQQIKVPPEGATSSSVNDQVTLLDCVNSPDGAYIITLVLFRGPELPPSIEAGQALQIYEADSLIQVKIVTLDSSSECYGNFLPVFSQCSRKIALRSKKHIKVYQLPPPKTLQALCRSVVLHYFGAVGMKRISAPQKTVDYLQFKAHMQ